MTPNRCGCTPATCNSIGWACGSGSNGCGGILTCPGCDQGTMCDSSHQCGANGCTPTKTCQTQGYQCGSFVDECGNTEHCGPTPSRDSTNDIYCAATSLYPAFYACPANSCPSMTSPPCYLAGPLPPEPGWSCVVYPVAPAQNQWCCAH
jgi:hypothetical protein